MVDTKELRRGNYAYCEGLYCSVKEIDSNGFLLMHEYYETSNFEIYAEKNDVEFIEINDSLLLKCGFEKYDKLFTLKLDGLIDRITIDLETECIDNCALGSGRNAVTINIKYLHELQNLYLLIMKTELIIKDINL